jgi:hypothetical protein
MKSTIAVICVTIFLVVFSFLCATGIAFNAIPYLFILSPFLVISMVLTVLRDTARSYPELGADEEWGYSDKPKDQLDIL